VKETGQEAVLDALHSYERRIIHMALVDDPDVHTYSEGEEPDRRVVISPRESE
jgi:spoIIIJ-associated protein